MEEAQCEDREKNKSLDEYSKEELIAKVKILEAHNKQLKSIISKSGESSIREGTQKKFDFSRCKFRHILLKFFYFGWDYHGFATQEDTTNTIEYHLFKALTKTCLIKDRASSNYHRCGRTDKGVSSYGQVISLDVRTKLCDNESVENEIDYCKVLNRVLPDTIQCVAWSPVDSSFSARFNCESRTYKYYFPKGNLDIEKMKAASHHFLGTHDFRNFCKMDVGNGVTQFTRNILSLDIEPVLNGDEQREFSLYVVTIRGKAFLWHQIRCIMHVLLLIGENKEDPNIINELLDVEKYPRKPDYNMASEIPLNLHFCEYESIEWQYSAEALISVTQKLSKAWTFAAIKDCMIKNTLTDLNQELAKIGTTKDTKSFLNDCLTQGVKSRNYVPLLKRQTCDSLEDKIKHFAKRRKARDGGVELTSPSQPKTI